MAEKRMFSKKIIDTDWFMDMPASSQNLYFHLSMRADDDGFVASPKRIVKLIGASEDDYKLLIAKKFIIVFDTGVCVIKDWRINNYLRTDRYTETIYQDEKSQLSICQDESYQLGAPSGIPEVSTVYISSSNSNSISNTNSNTKEDNIKKKYGEYNHVILTNKQYRVLCEDYGEEKTAEAIKYLDEYIQMKGKKYKDFNLTLRKWVFDAVEEQRQKSQQQNNYKPSTQKQAPQLSEAEISEGWQIIEGWKVKKGTDGKWRTEYGEIIFF